MECHVVGFVIIGFKKFNSFDQKNKSYLSICNTTYIWGLNITIFQQFLIICMIKKCLDMKQYGNLIQYFLSIRRRLAFSSVFHNSSEKQKSTDTNICQGNQTCKHTMENLDSFKSIKHMSKVNFVFHLHIISYSLYSYLRQSNLYWISILGSADWIPTTKWRLNLQLYIFKHI